MPIVLLTLLGAFLRFYALGRQGFWYDEAYTALAEGSIVGRALVVI